MPPESFSFYDLIDAFGESGCAVCRLVLRDGERFLNGIMHEYVMDPKMQASFRAGRGLCNHHGWKLTEAGNALGVAVLYRASLDELLNAIDGKSASGNTQNPLSRLFTPQASNADLVAAIEPDAPCVVCDLQAKNEARYVELLSERIDHERVAAAYRDSDGLCLEHFKAVLNNTSNADHARQLVTMQTTIWRDLLGEMDEFIRKQNVQYAHEVMGAEGDSWRRAIASLSGARYAFASPRKKT